MKQNKTKGTGLLKLSPVTWVGLTLVLALMLFNGYSLGKYMKEHQKEPLYVAENFYFESDLLRAPDNTGAIPAYTLKAGEKQFTFALRNYTDELRYSEVDIRYTVTVTDEEGNAVQTDHIAGTIAKGTCNQTSVQLSPLPAGTYIATAASAPYFTQLKAKFTVVNAVDALDFTVTDTKDAPTLQLTLETGEQAGNVVIRWPNGVLPDNSDPLMAGAEGTNGGEHIVTVEKNASYTFIFFKKNPSETYSKADFSVTQ